MNTEDIHAEFQKVLGRPASPDELNYFSRFVSEGQLQPYEIGQVLQGLPEAQQTRLPQYAQQYGQYLAQGDQEVMGRSADQLTSMFAKQGRTKSSGYVQAFANAARDLALQRQGRVADFYGGGLNQIYGQYPQTGQNLVNRGYGLRDEERQRQYQIEDYYRMQNDYNSALNARSGWNAITPEFVLSQGAKMGGQYLASRFGGSGGGGGRMGGMNA